MKHQTNCTITYVLLLLLAMIFSSSLNAQDDCKNCYWNICNYDVLKSFQGKKYLGINYDEGTHYFNCDNGVLVRKKMIVNGNGVIVNIITDTLLISRPVGARWGVFDMKLDEKMLSNLLGSDLSSASKGGSTLIADKVTTEVNGRKYSDVIVVNFRAYSKDFVGTNLVSTNLYYAKGIGLIRQDTLNYWSDPVAAINKTSDNKSVYSRTGTVKNGTDESIIGLWMYHNPTTNKDSYYRFNRDGTFDYYDGSITESSKLKGPQHWKMEGIGYDAKGVGVIDLIWAASETMLRYELSKMNDPATKKPAISIQGALLVSMDKQSW